MMDDRNNETAQLSLARLVVEEITGQSFSGVKTTVGPLMTNYFSFVFSIETQTDREPKQIFVKIPKEDLRQRAKSIFPISAVDRTMAEDEERSLRALGEEWRSGDLDVSWIQLRGVFPQYNAIATEAVQGEDALAVFRRMDMRRRFGASQDRVRLCRTMARLGAALGRFHQRGAQDTVFRLNETLPKLEGYCRKLEASVRSPWPNYAIQALAARANLEIAAKEVTTLKGIDIRNVLMGERDKLFLLDPGRMKRTCREADLARFIMTYRILYWGSGWFFLRLRPDLQGEEQFLQAYYSNSAPPSPKLLSIYLIKEQLKHWHTATESLRLRRWAKPLKGLIQSTYINPYYSRQLAVELKTLM